MDAVDLKLEQEKSQILARLAEIEVAQRRKCGMFKTVPHFNEIEDAGRSLGQFLSRMTQSRLAAEVAAEAPAVAECPECGRECSVAIAKRIATGLDGPTEMVEPKAHCPACRRDFFPST